MPVTAISGTGNIRQFCDTANANGPVFVKTVILSAHQYHPIFKRIDIALYQIALFNNNIWRNNKKKAGQHDPFLHNVIQIAQLYTAKA
jgi:hypothetical protein